MEGISDIRIVGMDETRPPRIRKEPYIDLCFRLSHKVPVEWCRDFTALQSQQGHTSSINADERLFIETWVRTPGEIAGQLQMLKKAITECNAAYIANIEASQRERAGGNDQVQNETGPQGDLNRIIAGLDFSE